MIRPAALACIAYYIIEMSLGLFIKPWGGVNINKYYNNLLKINGFFSISIENCANAFSVNLFL